VGQGGWGWGDVVRDGDVGLKSQFQVEVRDDLARAGRHYLGGGRIRVP
jgi:hypothetical protein